MSEDLERDDEIEAFESSSEDTEFQHEFTHKEWNIAMTLPPHTFSHLDGTRRIWEYLMMILSMFTIMEIVFIFFVEHNISFGIYSITFVVDIVFIIDIYIIRHTAILIEGEVITDPEKLWKHYQFPICHIISCIPLSWIGIIVHNKWVYLALSITKVFRISRWVTSYRMVKSELPYEREWPSILPMFFSLVFFAHLSACILIVIANSEGYANSFLAGYYLANYSQVQLYFTTIYFVLTTILTIGFGDICPVTLIEIIITAILQIAGVVLQTVITSFLVSYLLDPDESLYVQQYDVVQDFLHFKKVQKSLQREIRNFYQFQWETVGTGGSLQKVLRKLPTTIQTSVKLELTEKLFAKSDSMRSLSPYQLTFIMELIKLKTYAPGDMISNQGNATERLLMFRSGIIQFIIDGSVSASQNVSGGLIYGEGEFLLHDPRPCGIKAQTVVEVWVLRHEDLKRLLNSDADMMQRVKESIQINMPDILNRMITTQTMIH